MKKHIFDIIHFYYPNCMDDRGGYVNGFQDDGTIIDEDKKHLVGTARFIYIFSIGALLDGPDWCLDAVKHGIQFLQNHHYDQVNGGYYFELEGLEVKDSSKIAYGHAFTLLASAIAYQAGIKEAKAVMENVFHTMEQHFWDQEHGLYLEEWDAGWTIPSPYRGQNANMHVCEALLTAYESTGEKRYLDKAHQLAQNVTLNLAERSGGMVWENYTQDWQPDWEYNKNNTKDEFRPYGFVPGHQLEWSKLLMWLDRHRSEDWMLETAEDLFSKGWSRGHDLEYGGIYFALSPEEDLIDRDKNYWVMAEAIAAAALLADKTGKGEYWGIYDELFAYCFDKFIDRKHGGWYKMLNRTNERKNKEKSTAPKTDYHPVATCYQVIRVIS
ncbi:AGE family epimerase/isomerase [Sediminibacillus massiliensis]|uniref:AGE family epimerase/isomerase n=1 Tax=Sediminibacillus massiliensis TaxID=1926277 RepID=UPI001FE35527|nr:AGE family epimerase/isomerase [Sediminibacillus massiliensis]